MAQVLHLTLFLLMTEGCIGRSMCHDIIALLFLSHYRPVALADMLFFLPFPAVILLTSKGKKEENNKGKEKSKKKRKIKGKKEIRRNKQEKKGKGRSDKGEKTLEENKGKKYVSCLRKKK